MLSLPNAACGARLSARPRLPPSPPRSVARRRAPRLCRAEPRKSPRLLGGAPPLSRRRPLEPLAQRPPPPNPTPPQPQPKPAEPEPEPEPEEEDAGLIWGLGPPIAAGLAAGGAVLLVAFVAWLLRRRRRRREAGYGDGEEDEEEGPELALGDAAQDEGPFEADRAGRMWHRLSSWGEGEKAAAA